MWYCGQRSLGLSWVSELEQMSIWIHFFKQESVSEWMKDDLDHDSKFSANCISFSLMHMLLRTWLWHTGCGVVGTVMMCVGECLNVVRSMSVGVVVSMWLWCSIEGSICCIRKGRKTSRYYVRNIKLKLRAHVSASVTRVHPIGCTIASMWDYGVVSVGICGRVDCKIPCHGCVGSRHSWSKWLILRDMFGGARGIVIYCFFKKVFQI